MKLVAVIAAVMLASLAHAQVNVSTGSMVSPNLVGIGNSQGSGWTGTTQTTSTGGGYSGGSQPGYNASTNTIYFGYTQSVAAYTYAFSQALQNSGMTILGYNYSWDYLNQGMTSGNLSAAVKFAGVDGTNLHTKSWVLGPTTDWTNVAGTETFANNGMPVASIANFSLSFNGKDSRYWAGYYGPQVRNPSLSLNYTFDQCSSNPLSSPSCPGYAAAYLTQQCTANPLYNTSCPGYAAAYQIQQCTVNPLSDPSCPGYATAYLNYQCSVNPLYSTTCAGYAQAYLDSECIKDSLFSKDCKGYATAYAIKYLITGIDSTVVNQSLSDTAATKANDPATVKVATNTATTTVNTDGSVSVGVSTTGNSTIDKAIAAPPPTANSAAAPAAAVQLAPPPPGPSAQAPQERKPEGGADKPAGGPGPQMAQGPQGGADKPAAPTARQEIQAKREEAAKKDAVEKGKNLANEMGKAADMESQKQIQNVVIQAMGFTPGFDAYGKAAVPDVVGYKPFTVYNNQKNIDNRANLRMFGGNDRLHNEMVDSQYNRGN
jgi:hypothetical protein